MKNKTILVISDTQAPFHHKDTLAFLKHLKAKYKPDEVVHIGDLFDFCALSDYLSDPDGLSAGHELKEAQKFSRELAKIFPKMKILESNHDIRFYKRAFKAGIPRAMMRSYNEVFDAPPSWEWVSSYEVNNMIFVHGHQVHAGGGNVPQNAIRKYMKNVILGHFHTRFGIDYYANQNDLFFGMCVGSLIDHHSYAFQYQASEVRKPLIGTGVIVNGKPILEPMVLDTKGRWKK